MDCCIEKKEADCEQATPHSLSLADRMASTPHCEVVSVPASHATPGREHRSIHVTSLGDDLEGSTGELDLERSFGCLLDLCLVQVLAMKSKFDISDRYQQSKGIIQIQHHTYLKRTRPSQHPSVTSSPESRGCVLWDIPLLSQSSTEGERPKRPSLHRGDCRSPRA